MRERLFKFASFVALSAGFISCGKSIESRKVNEKNKSQALEEENFSISCYSQKNCPEYLAYIKHGSESCNASLVQDDLLVTSASCFPNTRPGLLCERLEIIFPETHNFQYQKLGCHKITKASSIGGSQEGFEDTESNSKRLKPAHFLYIKISVTGREPVKISHDFTREIKLQSFSFDNVYSDELFFHERECFVAKSSYASPLYKPSNRAPFALTNCLGKGEEKGAPIINERQELVGVVRDFFDHQDAENALDLAVELNLRPVLIANRSRCLIPAQRGLSKECQKTMDINDMNQSLYAMISKSISNERVDSFYRHLEHETGVKWTQTEKDYLHWGDEKAFELSLKPVCRFSKYGTNNPSKIPYFKSQIRLRKGWRLDHKYIHGQIENSWDLTQIPRC